MARGYFVHALDGGIVTFDTLEEAQAYQEEVETAREQRKHYKVHWSADEIVEAVWSSDTSGLSSLLYEIVQAVNELAVMVEEHDHD